MAINEINLFDDVVEPVLITGLDVLDSHIGALGNGLFVISGDSSTGKTALALQMATECKQSALYVTCEMDEKSIVYRLISRIGGLKLKDITNKRVTSQVLTEKHKLVAENTPFLHIQNGVNGFVSLEWIDNKVKEIKQQDGSSKVLVVIDSINSWLTRAAVAEKKENKLELAKQFAAKLNDYATVNDYTVVCIMQESNNQDMKDLIETFHYEANHHINLKWEFEGRENAQGIKQANLNLLKSRTSTIMNKTIKFKGDFQQYE